MIFFLYRDHETYGAIALLLVGKIYSHSGEAVSSGISSLYTKHPGWEFRPSSSMLEWLCLVVCI